VDITYRLSLAASLGIALTACGSPQAAKSCDTSAAAVARAAEYLIARDNASDLAGVLAGYSDDVTWYPPRDPPLHGIEAIRPRYEDLFSQFAVALRSEVLEASGNGDSGFVIGTTQGTLTPLAGGQAVEVNDRFVAIVRCVAGEWKVSRLFWGPQVPNQAPSE
jgi:ketosteroid isomerase-like protein